MNGGSKLSWYAHRLKAMSLPELWHRLGENWKHLSDGSFSKRLAGLSLGPVAVDFPALPEGALAPKELKQQLAADARKLLRGDWKLYGWRVASTGAPPCWHRDASSGVVVEPDELSHKLDHRHLPDGADARTIWEINRWSEMTRVVMHGWLNGDLGAVRTAQIWLEDWCERNPVGHGINWTSTLEAGLRLINFTWFDALVHACGDAHLLEAQELLAGRIVPAHAAWVSRYRSFGSSANNHLLGEVAGLLHAVKRWPSLAAQIGRTEDLWSVVEKCVMSQFAADGGNREQALHYHQFAWEMAWHAALLMGLPASAAMERLRVAAEFFVRMTHPLEPWDYGDSDDAQVLPLVLKRSDALGEWQSWLAGHEQGAVLEFWLGPSPLRQIVPEQSQAEEGWWLAEESGMAVNEMAGWVLRLDASPLGYGSMAAHGHCDALHLSIWAGAQALVIDPGTGGYYGMAARRAELAAWEAHNGPQPAQGFTTPKRAGTFLLTHHHADPVVERVSPQRLKARLAHEGRDFTRLVDVGGNGTLSIEDHAVGDAPFKVLWTFAPECQISGGRLMIYKIKRGAQVWQLELSGDELVSQKMGETMVSRHYGKLEPAATLEIVAKGALTSEWRKV
ncbi:MAG: hypothetical protein JWO94_2440 [Verrucomicrobiaceae bacterium]|nr:hypothetical protein [Verrucomicrobiaceae bacterium]